MQLKITGGTYKGKRLKTNKNAQLRPTTEKTRLAIFSILGKDFFKEINPAMKIPVINDGGLILNESNAILLYLCDKYKSKLVSNSIESRAKIYFDELFFDGKKFFSLKFPTFLFAKRIIKN